MSKYKTTLSQDIEKLSDPNYKIAIDDRESAQLVVDLVMKFFYNYIYTDSHNTIIDSGEVANIIKKYRSVILEKELQNIDFYENNKDRSVKDLMRYMKSEHGYAIDMIGSIYSTAEIIIDIINRKIDPSQFDKRFVGLDLGTGSGVLLLAQHILAHRNKFDHIENYGIEINLEVSKRSKQIAQDIGFGKIIKGNTLNDLIYEMLFLEDKRIAFISNETITSPGVPMNTIDTDPYLYNNFMIKEYLGGNIGEFTEYFPSRLGVIRIGYTGKKYFLDKRSNFGAINGLKSFDDIDKFGAVITPEDIYINGEYVSLIDIGDRIKKIADSGIKHTTYRRG